MSEPTVCTLGGRDTHNGFPLHFRIGCHHHLGNTVCMLNGLRFLGKVDQDHFDLASVIRVDGTGCIEAGKTLFDGEPAPGADLCFVSIRQLYVQTSWYQSAFQGLQCYGSFQIGAQIKASSAWCAVFRQRIGRLVDDLYVDR